MRPDIAVGHQIDRQSCPWMSIGLLKPVKGGTTMTVRPDPTFHASAKLAMQAPVENYAYTVMLSGDFSQSDGLAVVEVNPKSKDYGKVVHTVIMPNKGDEFHHFGWNACSSALSPLAGHAFVERRYLIIPGMRSSRIYVIDTCDGPTKAKIHKIIEPQEVFA
jgi:selenium-binding protein 1